QGLLDAEFGRIHPAHLAGADPQGAAAGSIDDGIGLDVLATFQAKSRSSNSGGVGVLRVTTRPEEGAVVCRSQVCARSPPLTRRRSSPASAAAPGPIFKRRRWVFFFKVTSASSSNEGAMMASRNRLPISRVVSASTARLRATTPPKADWGSVSRARAKASAGDMATATPQGLLCLMTAAAG